MFFRVVCKWFTPDAVFYVFGRYFFGLCVNALRLIPRLMCSDGLLSGSVSLRYGCSVRLPGCPDCSARCIGMRDRPTIRLSRAADGDMIECDRHVKE